MIRYYISNHTSIEYPWIHDKNAIYNLSADAFICVAKLAIKGNVGVCSSNPYGLSIFGYTRRYILLLTASNICTLIDLDAFTLRGVAANWSACDESHTFTW